MLHSMNLHTFFLRFPFPTVIVSWYCNSIPTGKNWSDLRANRIGLCFHPVYIEQNELRYNFAWLNRSRIFFFFASFLWIEERKTEFLHKSSRSHTNREQVATAIMLILFQCKISFQCNDWTVNMNTHSIYSASMKRNLFFS